MDIPYGLQLQTPKCLLMLAKSVILILLTFVFPVLQAKDYSKLDRKERLLLLFAIFNFFITAVFLVLASGAVMNVLAYPRYMLNAVIVLDIVGIQYFARHTGNVFAIAATKLSWQVTI